jgi:hypothetical protein
MSVSSNSTEEDGFEISNSQFFDASGNLNTQTTFITTAEDSDIQITQDLSAQVLVYDNMDSSNNYLNEIKFYASQIQCSDFHGKGTIEDYNALFQAASRIANESKQMNLDVDIEGFNEFADAAEQLSELFTSFTKKLENVSIINDSDFLRAISIAMQKIWKLSETFGKFQQTILATSKIQIPKSSHEAKVAIESAVQQINCSMKYISHFVDNTTPPPDNSELSEQEKNIINNAVQTIDNWNILCNEGVSIAMSNNPDIIYIQTANDFFKTNANTIKTASNKLKAKLQSFGLQ